MATMHARVNDGGTRTRQVQLLTSVLVARRCARCGSTPPGIGVGLAGDRLSRLEPAGHYGNALVRVSACRLEHGDVDRCERHMTMSSNDLASQAHDRECPRRRPQNTVIMQPQDSQERARGGDAPAFEATPAGWNDVHTPHACQAETTSARKTMRSPPPLMACQLCSRKQVGTWFQDVVY